MILGRRNGASERSPLVGKYCSSAPPALISVTNELYIRFKTDSSRGGRGFALQWDSASQGCGGALSSASGTIHSPNYPQPFGSRAECFWSVVVAQGSVVKAMFSDLGLTPPGGLCVMDYVEVRRDPRDQFINSSRKLHQCRSCVNE